MATFVKNHKQPYAALTSFVKTNPLAGKTVFVTGAGRGVGQFITQAIAEAGAAKIGVLGRDKNRIDKANDTWSKEFPDTTFVSYAADVTDEKAITAAFKDFGHTDVLVNNAGVFPDDGPFIEQDLKTWFSGFEINILGTAIVTQQFLRTKKAGSNPVVLNVSSMAAHMRFPLTAWAGYNSSKLGQLRVFEYLVHGTTSSHVRDSRRTDGLQYLLHHRGG